MPTLLLLDTSLAMNAPLAPGAGSSPRVLAGRAVVRWLSGLEKRGLGDLVCVGHGAAGVLVDWTLEVTTGLGWEEGKVEAMGLEQVVERLEKGKDGREGRGEAQRLHVVWFTHGGVVARTQIELEIMARKLAEIAYGRNLSLYAMVFVGRHTELSALHVLTAATRGSVALVDVASDLDASVDAFMASIYPENALCNVSFGNWNEQVVVTPPVELCSYRTSKRIMAEAPGRSLRILGFLAFADASGIPAASSHQLRVREVDTQGAFLEAMFECARVHQRALLATLSNGWYAVLLPGLKQHFHLQIVPPDFRDLAPWLGNADTMQFLSIGKWPQTYPLTEKESNHTDKNRGSPVQPLNPSNEVISRELDRLIKHVRGIPGRLSNVYDSVEQIRRTAAVFHVDGLIEALKSILLVEIDGASSSAATLIQEIIAKIDQTPLRQLIERPSS